MEMTVANSRSDGYEISLIFGTRMFISVPRKVCSMNAKLALLLTLSRGRKLKVLFYPMLPAFPKNDRFLEVFQASSPIGPKTNIFL